MKSTYINPIEQPGKYQITSSATCAKIHNN